MPDWFIYMVIAQWGTGVLTWLVALVLATVGLFRTVAWLVRGTARRLRRRAYADAA